MHIRTLLALVACLAIPAGPAAAQSQSGTISEAALSIGTTFTLQSDALSEQRTIHVAVPPGYDASTERYPVVYVLDAQTFWLFQYAYGETNALAGLSKMPPVILVGIESADRSRDMTVASPTNKRGRADEFRSFLGDELRTFIDSRYRTAPYKVLIGHSLGGSFALHTLAHAPGTFNAYIAMSPALQVDDGKVYKEIEEALDSDVSFANSVFTSLADEDAGMLEYYETFLQLMSDTVPAGLEFSQMRFPEESHGSTPMPGMHHGLLAIWSNWVPPDSIDSFDAMLRYYENLSERYGYPITMSAPQASRLGLELYDAGDVAGALEIFEYSLAKLGRGPIEYHQMGLALRDLGRLDEALVAFEKSVALGEGSRFFDMFVNDRDDVVQRIRTQNETERP